MSELFDTIQQALDPGTVERIGYEIGADPASAQRGITAALPLLLGAMAQRAATDGRPLQTATASPEAKQAADTVTQPATVPQPASPGLLSSLLGPHHDELKAHVAQASGLNPQQAGKLLLYVAPVILGALARHTQSAGTPAAPTAQDSSAWTALLADAESAATQYGSSAIPALGQLVGSLFSR